MELFLHPWFMAAGGLLVSAPILIHLINRMRFKRIRWAAMEFLLKSQKRNRRRLIIEQMILLALRCLLVLLAGFLVARFVGARPTGQGATHIVIVDDTPSMADQFSEKGPKTNSFEVAREQIKLLAHCAASSPRPCISMPSWASTRGKSSSMTLPKGRKSCIWLAISAM